MRILPEDSTRFIEEIGRTCYQSHPKTTSASHIPFVQMLVNKKHFPMLEFADVTVNLITNRGVTHELVRHRHASYAQESTRYVNYVGRSIEFIKPVWWNDDWMDLPTNSAELYAHATWRDAMMCAETAYIDLVDGGWSPQMARDVLPNALKTEIKMKANLVEWRHVFSLRCAPQAHPQIQALFLGLLRQMHQQIPVVFDDLIERFVYDKSL
jgi:thymidylate synthase (FAD)